IASARAAGLPHLQSFCNGLELDRAAVDAGLTPPHHNGRTEGVNTHTKGSVMNQVDTLIKGDTDELADGSPDRVGS
ncbi:hypothetical protein ACIO5D_38465, partial [Kitasatospora sp. NPDC087315]